MNSQNHERILNDKRNSIGTSWIAGQYIRKEKRVLLMAERGLIGLSLSDTAVGELKSEAIGGANIDSGVVAEYGDVLTQPDQNEEADSTPELDLDEELRREVGRKALAEARAKIARARELDKEAAREHARTWPTRERPGYGLVEDGRGYGIVVSRETREKLGGALWELAGGDSL